MGRGDRRHVDAPGGGQPDRDRILYSPEFRRLAAVTQVADAEGGLLFHNRLTHSLKVAHIALRLARNLINEYADLATAHGGIDPDVVESAALAHDCQATFISSAWRQLKFPLVPTSFQGPATIRIPAPCSRRVLCRDSSRIATPRDHATSSPRHGARAAAVGVAGPAGGGAEPATPTAAAARPPPRPAGRPFRRGMLPPPASPSGLAWLSSPAPPGSWGCSVRRSRYDAPSGRWPPPWSSGP